MWKNNYEFPHLMNPSPAIGCPAADRSCLLMLANSLQWYLVENNFLLELLFC